ncbi:MAG: hypothetical protein U0K87_04720 [Ruminococcus sp.]|nr:hypothetical protein [Ruminococcus sp.]
MTSNERKYYLLKLLQRNFSSSNEGFRLYLYTFFCDLFADESVVVSEDAFNQFIEISENNMERCAKKGYIYLSDAYGDENFSEQYALLQKAFLEIGIDFQIIRTSSNEPSGELQFTLPNGTVKSCFGSTLTDGWTTVTINARFGAEYLYAKKMNPWHSLKNMVLFDIDEVEHNPSGGQTYWRYYPDSKTIEFFGTGATLGTAIFADTHGQLAGSDKDREVYIFNSGITRLRTDSCNKSNVTYVFFHGENAELVLDEGWMVEPKSASDPLETITIYTDNLAIRNYTYSTNLAVTFRALNEWGG